MIVARAFAASLLVSVSLFAVPVSAHELPTDVRIALYVAPEADRVEVLLRVPLEAMRDIDFPLRGPGYLDLARVQPQLETAARLWLIPALALEADGQALPPPRLAAVRVALPSNRDFDTLASARQGVYSERLPADVNVYYTQALLDVALVYPNPFGAEARFSVTTRFRHLGQQTLTRITYAAPDGETRTFAFPGDPGTVSLDPGPLEVFGRFVAGGFEHVLDGTDHLLFVLALVIPLMAVRALVVVITAFTLAHSLTLIAAVLGLVPTAVWFPAGVELVIAASIFYMALENVVRPDLKRRWRVAFAFGLVHGFGFSFALTEMLDLAGAHRALSLLGFNVGIELGQLLVLALAVPVLHLAGRFVPPRALALVLSVLIAHTAWHWLGERWTLFPVSTLEGFELDAAFLWGAVRWLMLGVGALLLAWVLWTPFERWTTPARWAPPDRAAAD